jgi:DNA-binding MltR family transcriptional regulator
VQLNSQIAKHFRDIHFGGNWTSVNLKDTVSDLSWQQATTQVHTFNTIATLVYHMNYYVDAVLKVFQGGILDAKDQYSFTHPPLSSQEDWVTFLDKVWADAENFARLVEELPEHKWMEDFTDPKYGNYYRNIHGIIEHMHYHLGQIVLIKKLVLQSDIRL